MGPVPAAAAIALTLLLAACGDSGGGGGDGATGGVGGPVAAEVVLKATAFNPDRTVVEVGQTVRWVWDDGALQHDVKFDDLDVESDLKADGDFTHSFADAGVFPYVCTIHPQMTGEVEVTSGPAGL